MGEVREIERVERTKDGALVTYKSKRQYVRGEERDVARERVAQLARTGMKGKQIAVELGLSEPTVGRLLREARVSLVQARRESVPQPYVKEPDTPDPKRVTVMVDLDELIEQHRERIIRRLVLGKRQAIQTAVIELLGGLSRE